LKTPALARCGDNFISNIRAERTTLIVLEGKRGHFCNPIPEIVQRAKAATVKSYMPVDMDFVSLVWIIFHDCGAKLVVDAIAAAIPRAVKRAII
jgi:hypothetical protein